MGTLRESNNFQASIRISSSPTFMRRRQLRVSLRVIGAIIPKIGDRSSERLETAERSAGLGSHDAQTILREKKKRLPLIERALLRLVDAQPNIQVVPCLATFNLFLFMFFLLSYFICEIFIHFFWKLLFLNVKKGMYSLQQMFL